MRREHNARKHSITWPIIAALIGRETQKREFDASVRFETDEVCIYNKTNTNIIIKKIDDTF